MFDFVNYTYSGLLSIIAALIGLACPLIIGRIEDIDKRYESTLLTARFTHELSYCCFRVTMIVNVIVAFVIPFILDGSSHARIWIAVQSAFMIVLLLNLFVLFSDMLIYASPEKLHLRILEDYYAEKDPKVAALYFSQWVDVTPKLIVSTRYEVTQYVYDVLYKYARNFQENHDGKEAYDDYFLTGITRINEYLCQKEHRLISINNSNSILTILMEKNHAIPYKNFQFIWKNLILQSYYGQDEWIMSYWEYASQRYQSAKFNATYIDWRDPEFKSKQEAKRAENWEFLEFHIVLVAMLLQKNKYDLVRRMLSFSNTRPEEYPLVPSTTAEILNAFYKIYVTSNEPGRFLYYEAKFATPDMHGISDGKILGAVFSYLVLLLYRIYTLPWYYGEEAALRHGIGNTQISLHELHIWEQVLQTIRYWVSKNETEKELLKVVNYDSQTISIRQERQGGRLIPTPNQIINAAESYITTTTKRLKEDQPYSQKKIDAFNEGVASNINNALVPYTIFINQRSRGRGKYEISCSTNQCYPNAAFVDNPDISYVNVDSTLSHISIDKLQYNIFKILSHHCQGKVYTISAEDILGAIDKLQLDDRYVILSCGYEFDETAQKNELGILQYGRVDIYEMPISQYYARPTLYIISKDDIPEISFKKAPKNHVAKYELKPIDKNRQIWLSLLRLKKYPKLQKGIIADGNMNENALLTLWWMPVVKIKKKVNAVVINVWNRFENAGNPDELKNIKPIL